MVRQLTSSPLECICTRKMEGKYADGTSTGSRVKKLSKIEEILAFVEQRVDQRD